MRIDDDRVIWKVVDGPRGEPAFGVHPVAARDLGIRVRNVKIGLEEIPAGKHAERANGVRALTHIDQAHGDLFIIQCHRTIDGPHNDMARCFTAPVRGHGFAVEGLSEERCNLSRRVNISAGGSECSCTARVIVMVVRERDSANRPARKFVTEKIN